MNSILSKHAQIRMQQRAIPQLVVECLIRFGHCEPSGDGTCKYYFDKRSYRRFEAYAGPAADSLREFFDAYVVLGPDSVVVTAACRMERIKRR